MRVATRLPTRLLFTCCVALAGCGGPSLLREARPLESSGPLPEARDERILASIETVILPNGQGAWAKDAEWDEYLVRIHTVTDEPVEIREIAIFDAFGQRIGTRPDRGALIVASREIEQRYVQAGWGAKDGNVPGWVAVAGAGTAGSAAIAATAAPGFAGAAALGAAAATLTGVGVILAGAGVVRIVNNVQLDNEIQRRRSQTPLQLAGRTGHTIDAFFPLTPMAGRVQVVYFDRDGEHRLDIDSREALAAFERNLPVIAVSHPRPRFPDEARRQRVRHGHVVARLALDALGEVRDVQVTESMPPDVFDQEAHRTFRSWKYNRGRNDARTVEAKMEFWR